MPIEYEPNPAKIAMLVPTVICEYFITHKKGKNNMIVKSLKAEAGSDTCRPHPVRSSGAVMWKQLSLMSNSEIDRTV